MSNIGETITGSLGGTLVVVCMIPQLYSIIKNKSCKDVSIEMYFILLLGELLWCIYGILKSDLQIIVTNAISCIISLCIIIIGIIYKRIEERNINLENTQV